MYCVTF